MSHPDHGTIERFVMGALEDDAAFVAHVASCDECSRKLQREATLELAMAEVQAEVRSVAAAQVQKPTALPSRLARRAIGPVLAFAAAAAALAWVGQRHRSEQQAAAEASAVRLVSCPDEYGQLKCIAEANRVGAHIEYPTGPIAALGRESGLTVHLEPKILDDAHVDLDEYLVKAKADLKACAEKAIVFQEAPLHTGQVEVDLTIKAGGGVAEDGAMIILHAWKMGAKGPSADVDRAMADCLYKTSTGFPFPGSGNVERVNVLASYVWRE